jgi:hypothetical protein
LGVTRQRDATSRQAGQDCGITRFRIEGWPISGTLLPNADE